MTDGSGGPAPEGSLPAAPASPDFVILTGMSGAGRSTVANALEDSGWFVVDNLPPQLLLALADLARERREREEDLKVVAVVDVRGRRFFDRLEEATTALRQAGWWPQFVFLDATDETLVRRYESVRRPHPLQGQGRLLDGIQKERDMVRDLRSRSEVLIDTSGLNVHELTRKVRTIFSDDTGPALRLAVMSFGFKYGIPLDADFVFDLRFLPNPYWVPELRASTGCDAPVADYVLGRPGADEFIEAVAALMGPVGEGYLREGRRYATIAVGCTGGKHRSVAIAEALGRRLQSPTTQTFVVHRDLGQE